MMTLSRSHAVEWMIGGVPLSFSAAATTRQIYPGPGGLTERLAPTLAVTRRLERDCPLSRQGRYRRDDAGEVFAGISNPSWILLDPLHRVLYAVNEKTSLRW